MTQGIYMMIINTFNRKAWNKYGEVTFRFEVLEDVERADNLIRREQHHIDAFQSQSRHHGYNIAYAQGGAPGSHAFEKYELAGTTMEEAREIRRLSWDLDMLPVNIAWLTKKPVKLINWILRNQVFNENYEYPPDFWWTAALVPKFANRGQAKVCAASISLNKVGGSETDVLCTPVLECRSSAF